MGLNRAAAVPVVSAATDGTAAGLAVRRLAVTAIADVLAHRAPLDDVLERLFAADAALSERDRGLVRAIATVAFRRLGTIRRALSERMQRGMPDNAGELEAILVAGAAQVLYLDVPDHAAVDCAVRLAKAGHRAARYADVVNGVLRRIAREKDAILAGTDPLFGDTPYWLAYRWIAAYGVDAARAIAAAHGREPTLDITVRSDPSGWAERLGGIVLPTGSIRLVSRAAVTTLPGYAEGEWWVQDAAAAIPARLLAARPGERVADVCAAPGGKTAQLAATGADIVAVDRSGPRLKRLEANMKRLGFTVAIEVADATALDMPAVDAILLDAPCSATGTIRRHPDVAWIKTLADIARLAALQARLLDRAVTLLKPGGRLVYCTCSLEPEEGEQQIAALLARDSRVERAPLSAADLPWLDDAVTADGDARLLPTMLPDAQSRLAGMDGFFAARLMRRP